MVYGLARGLLISAMGLVMFGVAGALLREGMGSSLTAPADKPAAATTRQVKLVRRGMPFDGAEHRAANEATQVPARGREWWRKMLGIPAQLQAA